MKICHMVSIFLIVVMMQDKYGFPLSTQVSLTEPQPSISLFTWNPGATSVIVCCHWTDTTWQLTTEQQHCNMMTAWPKWWQQRNHNPTTHQQQQQPTNSELTQSFPPPPFPYSHTVQVPHCWQWHGNQTMNNDDVIICCCHLFHDTTVSSLVPATPQLTYLTGTNSEWTGATMAMLPCKQWQRTTTMQPQPWGMMRQHERTTTN